MLGAVLHVIVMLAAANWVQRSSLFLEVADGVAIAFAVLYGVVYLREKAGLARPRRLRSAASSAIGLICFAIFIAARVFVFHA